MENRILFSLDKPDNNDTGYFRFYFHGWVLPSEKVKKYKLFLNDKQTFKFKIRKMKRPDLISAFPEIANADDGGFEGIVDVGSEDGEYNLAVYGVTDKDEHVLIGQKKLVNLKTIISAPPQVFYLGLISHCNLSCNLCPIHSPKLKNKFEGGIMEKKISAKVLSELKKFSPSLKLIYLQEYGEPFLYKDLFEIIKEIEEILPNTNIGITSNGTLLNDNLIEKLLKSKISSITFSLDAATEQTYQKIRVGGNFQLVIRNIKKLIAQRKKMNLQTPTIATNFVITRLNLHEIPQYFDLCEMMGVDGIGFVHPFGLFDSDKEDLILPLNEKENEYSRLFLKIKNEIEIAKPNLINRCNIPNILPNEFITDCSFNGKSSMFINIKGDIYPCCVLAAKGQEIGSNIKKMGNVCNKSLQEIWDSFEFAEFRENFFKGNLPHPLCKMCPKYYGI